MIYMADRTALHVVHGRVTEKYYQDNRMTPFVWLACGSTFCLQDDNARAHSARVVNAHLQQQTIYRIHGQQWTQTFPPLNTSGTW